MTHRMTKRRPRRRLRCRDRRYHHSHRDHAVDNAPGAEMMTGDITFLPAPSSFFEDSGKDEEESAKDSPKKKKHKEVEESANNSPKKKKDPPEKEEEESANNSPKKKKAKFPVAEVPAHDKVR